MRFNVTDIEFDFSDSMGTIPEYEAKAITAIGKGIWDASDEDDLIEQITELSGWCIKSIDYKSMEDSNMLNNINGATL